MQNFIGPIHCRGFKFRVCLKIALESEIVHNAAGFARDSSVTSIPLTTLYDSLNKHVVSSAFFSFTAGNWCLCWVKLMDWWLLSTSWKTVMSLYRPIDATSRSAQDFNENQVTMYVSILYIHITINRIFHVSAMPLYVNFNCSPPKL